MIKKSILSVFGGVIFAAFVSLAVPARAGCLGYCADRIGNYYYAGCDVTFTCSFDGVAPLACWPSGATCYYTEGGSRDPNIAE